MFFESFGRFLRDERGSYTIWSLIWFMLYVGIGGLAVDVTDVYRNQSLLQATADSACLAGVMSLPNEDEAVNQAMFYSARNMDPREWGWVLKESDILIGTWDPTVAKDMFKAGGTDPNAVYVRTQRADANRNPVAMNFLRIMMLLGWRDPSWNVAAEAVCVRYLEECATGGFLAGGKVFWRSNTGYFRRFCIHGMEGGVAGRNNNSYELGVSITHGPMSDYDFPPPALKQDDLQNALKGSDVLWPSEATQVGTYIETLRGLDTVSYDTLMTDPAYEKYRSWGFLYEDTVDGYVAPTVETTLPAEPQPYKIYDIDCSGKLELGEGFEAEKAAIIASCPIHAASSFSGGDAILASTATGGQAVHLAAKSGLGDPDFCDPGDGGGLEILTPGGIHISAQGEWHGVRMIAGEDVKFTSKNSAGWGLSVVAGGNIDASSNNEFGLCPGKDPPGPVEWRYRLVY